MTTPVDPTPARRSGAQRGDARFWALLEASGNAALITDAQGRVVEDQPSWQSWSGRRSEEIAGRGWLDVLHPDDRSMFRSVLDGAIASGSGFGTHVRVRCPTGHESFVWIRGVPVCDDQGGLVEWILTWEVQSPHQAPRALESPVVRIPRLIIERITDAIVALDRGWRFTYLNPPASRLLDRRAEEMIGRNVWEVLPTLSDTILGRQIRGAMAANRPMDFEAPLGHRPTWHQVQIYPTAEGLVLYLHNIDQRKHVETALQLSERRSLTLIDTIGQIVWILHPDGDLAFFNQRWYSYTGRTGEDAGGTDWIAAIHPDDQSKLGCFGVADPPAAEGYEFELRIRCHDGMFRWHLARIVPLTDDGGTVLQWIGAAADIEDLKRAEDDREFLAATTEMLTSSLDFDQTLEHMAHAVIPRLADVCLIDVFKGEEAPRRAAAVHRDPAMAPVMQRLMRFPPAPDSPSPLYAVLQTGESLFAPSVDEQLCRRIARNAEHLDVIHAVGPTSIIMVPLRARGRTLGALTVVRVHAAVHYNEHDRLLAQDVARRAALAVDNAWLYQEAQNAIREREALLSVASHELKNPLTTLIGYSQLLSRSAQVGTVLRERDVRAVRVIREQTSRLNGLLDTLLDLSQLSSGLEIVREQLDLRALVAGLVEELEPTLPNHVLNLEAADLPLMVEGDSKRLIQVFRNLLSNAVKYSPLGSTIALRLNHHDDQVCAAISDQGIGIPAEQIPKLFTRFYRVPDGELRRIDGLGVGLYVVKEIVAAHGGTIEVQSIPGQGSTFTVCLPAATGA